MKIPGALTALVIDDNDYARAMAATSLEKLGIGTVFEAPDAAGGLKALKDHQPDFVLLDWYMPDINGAGFVMMAREGGLAVPVIVTTAYATKTNLTRMRDMGIGHILIKPFEQNALYQAIGTVLGARPSPPKAGQDDSPERFLI